MRLIMMTLLMASLGGCNYDRSFMSIDSDSGVPFMGLQLEVNSKYLPGDSSTVPSVGGSANRWMTTSFVEADK